MIDGGIKHVEINLGRLCNNRCIFCMIKDDKNVKRLNFASLAQIKNEINTFAKKGFSSLGFLGGEPSLYPNISEIVSYARLKGFSNITLVSNGRRFSDVNFLKSLVSAGITRFCVSIHSHIPEIEDEMTRVQGGFLQKMIGIENLVNLRKDGIIKEDIAINIVVNKKNYKSLVSTIDFFRKEGVKDFRLNFIRPEGRAWVNFELLVPKYSDFRPYIKKILYLAEKENIHVSLGDIPFCILPDIKENIGLTGEVRDYINLVVSFDKNRKNSKSFKETFLWKERRQRELKSKGRRCSNCSYNSICEGPWKNYVKNYGFSEFKPIK